LRRKVFDGNDMQRIDRGYFLIGIQHGQTLPTYEQELGVWHKYIATQAFGRPWTQDVSTAVIRSLTEPHLSSANR
jgi:hypothetical protein